MATPNSDGESTSNSGGVLAEGARRFSCISGRLGSKTPQGRGRGEKKNSGVREARSNVGSLECVIRAGVKVVERGESPEEVYLKLLAARTFRAGSLSLRQLRFACVDLELHTKYTPDGSESVFDVDQRVSRKTQVIPPFPEDRFLCGFNHILLGGYAAGYYSYKWAEVLSADAFSAFEDAGLDDIKAVKETGHKFRETIFALGGGKAPLEVFVRFRGREPSPEALLRHNGLLPVTA
ncbi:probable cytosolic oligopeptidase A [Hibiscus syriacus]|uniref:probable cytosolic oligopeptidase A n=1 Tax=Hibiscus syriacus TaxID=106335 RepID=UPI001924E216|nr:probable cytosolic oligopeptidase A [Hibiscus syriacus]